MQTGLQIKGDLNAVLRFQQFPDVAHDKLLATLNDIETRLFAAVLADTPNRTGALRAMIGGKVYDHKTRIAAVVGVRAGSGQANEAKKAAALEYGSRGTAVEVRAYEMSLNHVYSRFINPIMVNVPEHARVPRIAAHRFLRDPAAAVREDALAQMQQAINEAVAESNNANA